MKRARSEFVEALPKGLSEEPIRVPGSPFWNVFKRFGRDEFLAMLINVFGTALASFVTSNLLVLSVIGPVIEKAGFFPAHFRDAWGVYKTTSRKRRRGLLIYVKKAFKGGFTSLVEDLLVHDPFYVGLMFAGLYFYPGTPAWLLSGSSFVLAVFAVSGLEVGFTELGYAGFKRRMKRAGFGFEPYFESRFFISSKKKPWEVVGRLAKAFGLKTRRRLSYRDRYFGNRLPVFSGRLPRVRFRRRVDDDGSDLTQTVQIVYTRAYEASGRVLEQYRYFPIRKEKLYFFLKQEMPWTVEGVRDLGVRGILEKALEKGAPKDVRFRRGVAYGGELLVSADEIRGKSPFFVLELKVYSDVKLLVEAMRFVMREFPVVQTTRQKSEFVFNRFFVGKR